MPTVLLVLYVMGAAVTALVVLRNRVFASAYLVNVGAIGLWPIYWTFYLTSMIAGRSRGPSK